MLTAGIRITLNHRFGNSHNRQAWNNATPGRQPGRFIASANLARWAATGRVFPSYAGVITRGMGEQ